MNGFETPVERAEMIATAMVTGQPDAIITSSAMTRIVQRATKTIPILAVSDDLLAEQAIASLAHLGGNTAWRTAEGMAGLSTNGRCGGFLTRSVSATERASALAFPLVVHEGLLRVMG